MTDATARERATRALHSALTHDGLVMPLSATAAIVNDLVETAVTEATESLRATVQATLEELAAARVEHDGQIAELIKAFRALLEVPPRLLEVPPELGASEILDELERRRG